MDEKKQMMKQKSILNECYEVMTKCEKTIKWMHTFLKGNPSIVEIPEELKLKIDTTRLELYDTKIMIEKLRLDVGKKKDNL